MIQSFEYFPTIIYRDEHPEWVDYLLKLTGEYFKTLSNEVFIRQTNELCLDDNFNFFTNYTLETTKKVLSSQGYITDKYDFYVSNLWAQEINPKGSTNIHFHKNSQLCGWIFLETPTNGSYPIYYDPRVSKKMIELDSFLGEMITNSTPSIHFPNIIPGTVIFSNSWIEHQLSVNYSDLATKCLHFIISHKDKLCNIC